jgi:UDP-N-acetylmuramate dehydrogenase
LPASPAQAGEEWFRAHASGFSGQLSFGEPLSKHTYYRIGGPARVFAVPKSLADLQWLHEGLRAAGGMPVFVLGSGSNLLVSDEGFDGLIVRATRVDIDIRIDPIEADGAAVSDPELIVRAGGGVAVSSLLRRAAQEGWGGLELLTGIPGSIGGVVAMNAGTHLGEAKDRLVRVEAFDLDSGRSLVFERRDFKYVYRGNHFLPAAAVVTSAHWKVRQEEPAQVKSRIDETLIRRKATQPLDAPSCGSVFKNPREHGKHAWQVIDQLGLRGHRIGGAQFAEKHSNFILNLGDAKAEDVRALIALAQERALRELGIALEAEVMLVGAFSVRAADGT